MEEIDYVRARQCSPNTLDRLNRIDILERDMRELRKEVDILRKENDKLKNIILIPKEEKVINKKKTDIRGTKLYKAFRDRILKRDNYSCVECGCKDRLQVHHIKEASNFPDLVMDENNVITLCITCHSKTDNFFKGVI